MEDLFKCICEFGDNHYWLRSFFKQVIFFLKRILANRVLYDVNHNHFSNENIKCGVWKEMAYDYKGQFTQSDSSDGSCADGCNLKLAQKLAQHQLVRIVKSLRRKVDPNLSTRLNTSKTSAIDSAEIAEVSDGGLIDFLHVVAFVLECIVANPVLYDRKYERYRDETFKLKVWNAICTVFHDKVQNDELELGDEDFDFEIKHVQKTIERYLYRLAKPLNMTRKASKAELNKLAIDIDSNSDTEYTGTELVTLGRESLNKQPVTINIAPSKTGSQIIKIVLNDGLASKKHGEGIVIESKNDRERSQIVDQFEQNSTPVPRTDSRSSQSDHNQRNSTPIQRTENRFSHCDRAQKHSHGPDKDRSPEALKRKKSISESVREQKHSLEIELSPEIELRKKMHKSNVDQSALAERPVRIKSIIQKKDASNMTIKTHNLRRK